MSKKVSILTIASSGLLSVIIATVWVNFGASELTVLKYLIVPIIITIITIILFLIADSFIANERAWLTIVLIIINLLAGLFMRLDFHYHFFS